MPFFPELRDAAALAKAIKGSDSMPNISIPIIEQAIGDLDADEKTAQKPIAAINDIGKGIQTDKVFPRVEPIKNKGVTSPPLKQNPIVNKVKTIFIMPSYHNTGSTIEAEITGNPKPKYRVSPIMNDNARTKHPPIHNLYGKPLINRDELFFVKCKRDENMKAIKPKIIPVMQIQPITMPVVSGIMGG